MEAKPGNQQTIQSAEMKQDNSSLHCVIGSAMLDRLFCEPISNKTAEQRQSSTEQEEEDDLGDAGRVLRSNYSERPEACNEKKIIF